METLSIREEIYYLEYERYKNNILAAMLAQLGAELARNLLLEKNPVEIEIIKDVVKVPKHNQLFYQVTISAISYDPLPVIKAVPSPAINESLEWFKGIAAMVAAALILIAVSIVFGG